jgi:glutaredoxin
MEFEKPSKGFTIYSKSGCTFCVKVKSLLKEKGLIFNMVDCDEYLIEDKPAFLEFIKELAGREVNSFPMIFFDGKFIGGYNETKDYLDKTLLSFEEYLNF